MKSIRLLSILLLFFISSQFESELSAQRKSRTPKKSVRSSPTETKRTPPKISAPSRNTEPARIDVERTPIKRPTPSPSRPPKPAIIDYDPLSRGNINYDPPERPRRKPSRIEESKTKRRPPSRITGEYKARPSTPNYPSKNYQEEEPGYCIVDYLEEEYYCEIIYDEIGYYYPAFPLRFIDAEINYLYSEEITNINNKDEESSEGFIVNDFYEISVTVYPRKFNYSKIFGVLIKNDRDAERLVLFNEKEYAMYKNDVYTFTKKISLDFTGHSQLSVGYYDKYNNTFYPAIGKGKTEMFVYVNKLKKYSARGKH